MMKQHTYWLFFILLLTGCNNKTMTESHDDIIGIPDSIFKSYLVAKFDTDNDGEISKSEAEAVIYIDVCTGIRTKDNKDIIRIDAFEGYERGNGITSLEGLEYFTSLTELRCQDNQLKKLDISENINLEYLECNGNQLEQLDISNNLKLKKLICSYNQIMELDVSKNKELITLFCSRNKFTELDVTKNLKLKSLECGYSGLRELDITHNKELASLFCYGNNLAELDVSNNNHLEMLGCAHNQLAVLDVSNNPLLEGLYCNNNNLDSLNLHNNKEIGTLICYNNKLTKLDLSLNPLLECLSCGNNLLKELNLNTNKKLAELACDNNQLTTLNLTNNPELVNLFYIGNPVTKIDIRKNKKLESINEEDALFFLKNEIDTAWINADKRPIIMKIVDENEAKNPDIQAQVFHSLRKRMFYTGRDSNLVQQVGDGYFSIKVPEATNRERLEFMFTQNTDVKIFKVYDFKDFDKKIIEINKILCKENISFEKLVDSVLGRPSSPVSSSLEKNKYDPLLSIFSHVIDNGSNPIFVVGSTGDVSYIPAINQCFERPDVKKMLPSNILLKWDDFSESSYSHLYALQTDGEGNAYMDGKYVLWADALYFPEKATTSIRLRIDYKGILILKELVGQWVAIVANDKVMGMSQVGGEINDGFLVIQNVNLVHDYTTTDAKDIIMKVRSGKINLPVALQVE